MKLADPDALMKELETLGTLPDEEIDTAEGALLLAALNHPGLSLDRYRHHLEKLCADLTVHHNQLVADGADDTAELRLRALKEIFVTVYRYEGDNTTYDDLQNANLIRVIDRRKGMPITLAIICLRMMRAQNWKGAVLNVPGHVCASLDWQGQRLIFDPFDKCAILQAADLRRLVKGALGPEAELSASYYEPASNRGLLIRLQNNIKTRQIEGEDYEGAARTVEAMRVVDPGEYRLLLDAGVLYARIKRLEAAAAALESYIALAPHDRDRHDAALLLQSIRQTLN